MAMEAVIVSDDWKATTATIVPEKFFGQRYANSESRCNAIF